MRYMVLCVPDWPVNCLVGDLPPSGCGAVVHGERIDVASAAARRAGVRAGMSAREERICAQISHAWRVTRTGKPGPLAPSSTHSTRLPPGSNACVPERPDVVLRAPPGGRAVKNAWYQCWWMRLRRLWASMGAVIVLTR